jgi:hypothetical protein
MLGVLLNRIIFDENIRPCDETVNWYIITQPMKLTTDQYTSLKSHFKDEGLFKDGGNNREVQPLGSRNITSMVLLPNQLKNITFMEVDSFSSALTAGLLEDEIVNYGNILGLSLLILPYMLL